MTNLSAPTGITGLMGLQVLVVGLGQEGQALAHYLARHGVSVTATDAQPEAVFGAAAQLLKQAGVSLALGGHPTQLLDQTHLLFVSPGVPLEIPFLAEARRRNLPFSTESRLFCHLCPAPVIAITGSSGKTTTTTLAGKILEADDRTTWVGGNIGRPLIAVVDQIKPGDAVVMELSSFQLEYFHAQLNHTVQLDALPSQNPEQLAALLDNWSPSLAALLNITPNHLDRHPSMKHYVRAKRAIIDYQAPTNTMIMGLDNDLTRTIGHQFGNRVRWFSLEAQVANGAGLSGNDLVLLGPDKTPTTLVSQDTVKLRGRHNLSNILAACLIAKEVGASLAAMRQVITTFTGVEHRLQLVRQLNNVSYYNDSISTSPERLIAALNAFSEPIILLAGGRDKHLPWEDAARLLTRKVRHAILFGEAQAIIASAISQMQSETNLVTAVHGCNTLAEAVALAARLAEPGQVVLLSPGCASYDAFKNFIERGHHFEALVQQL